MIGSGLDVWEIVHMVEDFGSPETLAADTHFSPAHIRLALAYRGALPAEIDAAIAENRRPLSDVGVLFPFVTVAGA